MSANHPPSIDMDALRHRIANASDQSFLDLARPQRDRLAAALEPKSGRSNQRDALDSQPKDNEVSPQPDAALPVPRLGAEAADNMTRLAKAAADDIRRLGRLAFETAKSVQDECERMAVDVESNAGTVALHLTGLSQLLADVGMSNRETLRRLLGDASPSIVPPGGSDHVIGHTAQSGKTAVSVPFGKNGRRPG